MAKITSISDTEKELKLPESPEQKAVALHWYNEYLRFSKEESSPLLKTDFLPKLQLHFLTNNYIATQNRPYQVDDIISDGILHLVEKHSINLAEYPAVTRWSSRVLFLKSGQKLAQTSMKAFNSLFLDGYLNLIEPQVAVKSVEGKKDKKDKKEDKKKEKSKGKGSKTPPSKEAIPEISKLEIRVGKITGISIHPEREKLFVEDIDFGEGGKRTIISGIVEHYPDSNILLNKKVCVVCNLKPRKMGCVTSQGMVLCATSEDSTHCVVVEAPINSELNERIEFDGLDLNQYEPFAPNKMAKQKVLEKLVASKTMRTNDKGEAIWKNDKDYTFKSKSGSCKTTILNGFVS